MTAIDSELGDPNRRLGDNRGPSIEDPGPARDYQLIGPLATYSEAVNPEHLERFLAAIRSHGDQAIRQSAISNALHRARADRKVSHVQYRLLEQTASRTRWVARYSSEPQEVRAWFASLKSGSNVGRFDAALVAQGYVVTIEVPRVSGGWPLVFSTIQCSSGDRTGESHGELLGRARRLFNGQERAARAGYNWSAASEPDAPPTCNGYDLASRNGYDSTTQNQGASRNGYELIVDRLLPTNQPSLGGNASGSCNSNELELNEAQYERWRDYAGVFGRGLQPVIKPFARDETDPILYGIVQTAAAKFAADIVCSATPRMLDGVGAKIADERRQVGPSKGCGLGALRKVAGPMMLEECGKVEREQKGLQAGVSTDGARDPAHYRPQSAPNGRRGGGWVAVGAQFAHPDKD